MEADGGKWHGSSCTHVATMDAPRRMRTSEGAVCGVSESLRNSKSALLATANAKTLFTWEESKRSGGGLQLQLNLKLRNELRTREASVCSDSYVVEHEGLGGLPVLLCPVKLPSLVALPLLGFASP
jgi:hypothetical protein|mmetsp:Transcript_19937/g.44513  ORF Transcript_19937/g.44513 Transcript_19937/m.44513 type:complete len:126 (-) Transcript_19937:184-561(-)